MKTANARFAIQTWDERLTSTQANRYLIQADVSRAQRTRHEGEPQEPAGILLG